jgi:hypothetical protein
MPEYKNPGKIEFGATIIEGGGGGMFIEFPHDVSRLFGVKGRVPVNATFDGIPYRGSLAKMGSDCHIVGVLKEIRQRLNKTAGDRVQVTIELDVEERKVELADDVHRELSKHRDAKMAWDKLSYTHQREYHQWIEQAKRSETRAARIAQMIDKLAAKTSSR